MAKSPEMEAMLEKFTMQTFGRSRQGNVCVACGSDKMAEKDFNSRLDYKESTISKMCQNCIDKVFGTVDEELDYFGWDGN